MDQYGYKTYLATKVLSEGQIVTYRTLSRALKIHVTHAKQMLYDFYTSQSAKRPSSISATYLISGSIRPASTATQKKAAPVDKDVPMDSSPVPSSWLQPEDETQMTQGGTLEHEAFDPADADVPVRHVVLVRQEELEVVKAEMQEVHWIHVYSLQPASPTDMHVLSVANEAIAKSYVLAMMKHPLEPLKGLGVIQNPNVRWRDLKNASVASAAVAATKAVAAAAKPASSVTASGAAVPTLSRESSSTKAKGSIMSSFAKGAAAPKKAVPPLASKQEEPKDVKMKDTTNFSDDDDEEEEEEELDASMLERNALKAAEARQEKATREAKLKALMDDSDSDTEMKDAPPKPAAEVELEAEEDEPVEVIDTSAALDAKPAVPTLQTEESTVSEGRRRGRRQVRKKRTFQDEDGYLVTKEEMEWESFSEDDERPKKQEAKKIKLGSLMPAASDGGKKRAGGQPPKQGNIMSFFGKK